MVISYIFRYIPVDKREDNDPATHKWMVYVRGPPDEANITTFVKKVWFFLHPSYRPNDLVEMR
jgi:transcription initiation factor IIF auxiliary subunit